MKSIRTKIPWDNKHPRDYRNEYKRPEVEELIDWLMENVGTVYKDWDILEYWNHGEYPSLTEIILWNDNKVTETMLRWG